MDSPTLTSHELDNRIANGRQMIDYLTAQLRVNRAEPAVIMQRLTVLKATLEAVSAQRKIDQQNERFARVFKVSRLISSSLDLDQVLQMTMDAIIELTGAERSFVMLLEDDQLTLKIGRNIDQKSLDSDSLTISHTVMKRAVEENMPIVTTNAQEDPRFAGQESVMANQLSSIMVTPLHIGERILGVIYVDSTSYTALFSEDELNLLNMFGEQVAIAIDNALQVEQRERFLREQIEALRIEIDEVKKTQQVAEITESDSFRDLAERAKELRAQRHKK